MWLNTRTANNCEIRSNWFEKISAQAGAGLSIKGKNHLVIGNRCKGGVNIACNRGDGTAAQVMDGVDIGLHPKAENCRFVGNRLESGTILVGTINSGAGTQEAALSNNIPISPTTGGNSRESGGDPLKLDKTGGASGTTFDADPESFTLPDRKLTPEEVGLKAPDLLS